MATRVKSMAKKKLKAHIERHSGRDDWFELTPQKISYWFGIINSAAFNGTLPAPEIIVRSMRSNWGLCSIGNNDIPRIEMNIQITSRTLFFSTLAHEMVHMWQYLYENGRMSHRGSYQAWNQFFQDHFDISL